MLIHNFRRIVAMPAIIGAAIFVSSCIDVDKRVGSENIPDDYTLKVASVQFDLPLRAKIADSLQALSSSEGYIGAIRTPELGLATFSCATNFCPYLTKADYGKDQIIKEFYIQFNKNSNFIAADSQEGVPQNIHVYRMTRLVDEDNRYNNTLTDADYIHTPVDSAGVIYTGGDTLTMRLKYSFARELLNATKLQRDSLKRFKEAFKGLLFACDPPEAEGGRVNEFDVVNGSMNLVINFQPTWAENLERKDTTLMYALGVQYVQNFSTYESKKLENAAPQEYLAVEGCGGLKAYLDPVALKDRIDAWTVQQGIDPQRVIVGKATYYLPYDLPQTISDLGSFYPQYLYPTYRSRDTSGVYYTPLTDVYSTNNNAGAINRSLNCYFGDMSAKIQKFFKADRATVAGDDSFQMWFMPVVSETSTSYYGYGGTTTFSSDLGGYCVGRINGPLHKNKPYLRIVYTILNDK